MRTMSLLDTKSFRSQTSIRTLDFEGFGGTEAQIRFDLNLVPWKINN
jgi:hypothetical protein